MSDVRDHELRAFLDGQTALPGWAFRDSGVFQEESEKIFSRNWISVGCAQSVAEPGSVFPLEIAGFSLLLVRDKANQVRVFVNMCLHRGSPLATEPCRLRGGLLACPYHGWVYSLDGRLKSAPVAAALPSSPDVEEAGPPESSLIAVRSVVWRDIVFVDLSGEAPPFEEMISPLDERLGHWSEAELRPLSANEFQVEVNWKLAAENFVDAYHLPVVHHQICPNFDGARKQFGVEVSDRIVGMIMPDGYGTGQEGTNSGMPLFSALDEDEKLRIETFVIFPNTLILVEPDYQQVIVIRPQGPALVKETFASYLASDAALAPELATQRDEVDRGSLEVNAQDVELLEKLQKTRSMPQGVHTRMAPQWDQTVLAFERIWARTMLGLGAS